MVDRLVKLGIVPMLRVCWSSFSVLNGGPFGETANVIDDRCFFAVSVSSMVDRLVKRKGSGIGDKLWNGFSVLNGGPFGETNIKLNSYAMII